MKRFVTIAGLGLAALAHAGVAAAQEAWTPPPMMFVYTDHVAPANTMAYEAASKDLIKKVRATAPGAKLRWLAASGMGSWYVYAFPMQTLADMAKIDAQWMAAVEAAGGPGIMTASAALVDHSAALIAAYRPDMSYTPANPRTAETEGQYRRYDYWYAIPGKAQDLEAVAREFVALYKANNIDSGWRVYQAVTGAELPLYVVVNSGMSPAEYDANGEKIDAMLGDKDDALFQKAFAFTRKHETLEGSTRPDLAAMGPAPMAETPTQ